MVLIATRWGKGLSKKERRSLDAERRRLEAEHRKKAGKNVATLSNPSQLVKKTRQRSGFIRTKINGRAHDHPDRVQARKARQASVVPRGTVPGWAVRLSTEFVRWCHDAHIKFRSPDRDMKEDSWQVSLVLPGHGWGREEWTETVRKLKGFEWVISHHKDGLNLVVWSLGRKKWRK